MDLLDDWTRSDIYRYVRDDYMNDIAFHKVKFDNCMKEVRTLNDCNSPLGSKKIASLMFREYMELHLRYPEDNKITTLLLLSYDLREVMHNRKTVGIIDLFSCH